MISRDVSAIDSVSFFVLSADDAARIPAESRNDAAVLAQGALAADPSPAFVEGRGNFCSIATRPENLDCWRVLGSIG